MDTNEITYPYIVFKLKGRLFCVNSQYVNTILQLPEYEQLPDAPANVTGIFSHRGGMVEMYDMRMALGMASMRAEYEEFSAMLDARKQDHIRWVDTLERSVNEKTEFTLATDPHKCAFGKWYDHYTSDSREVMFHLKKIDQPHRELHEAALDVRKCDKNCEHCKHEKCLRQVMGRVKDVNMPLILKLLDEAKEIFRGTVYHEMALVLSGDCGVGIIVDEVLSVDSLIPASTKETGSIYLPPMIRGVLRSEKSPELILEVDGPWLMRAVRQELVS